LFFCFFVCLFVCLFFCLFVAPDSHYPAYLPVLLVPLSSSLIYPPLPLGGGGREASSTLHRPSCPPGVQPLASGVQFIQFIQFVQFALLDLFCSKKCKICFTNLHMCKIITTFAAATSHFVCRYTYCP
jgi:hypothetical protein